MMAYVDAWLYGIAPKQFIFLDWVHFSFVKSQ